LTPIENVLGRVELARPRQPGQVSARCPAHADKGPSLSIRETPEGAVLLHCFAGCSVQEIVSAMGLELHELFPPRERPANAPKRIARLLTAPQALELLESEAQFVGIVAGNIGNGVTLTDDDRNRVQAAAGRIRYVRDQTMGGAHA
jgi:hypothetical protein